VPWISSSLAREFFLQSSLAARRSTASRDCSRSHRTRRPGGSNLPQPPKQIEVMSRPPGSGAPAAATARQDEVALADDPTIKSLTAKRWIIRTMPAALYGAARLCQQGRL